MGAVMLLILVLLSLFPAAFALVSGSLARRTALRPAMCFATTASLPPDTTPTRTRQKDYSSYGIVVIP